jgi:hypothetical protein
MHIHFDACLVEHLTIDLQGNLRFESEDGLVGTIDLSHPAVEIKRKALYDFHLAYIRFAKPACRKASDATTGLYEQNAMALASGLDCGSYAGRGGTIDADINIAHLGERLPALLRQSMTEAQEQRKAE